MLIKPLPSIIKKPLENSAISESSVAVIRSILSVSFGQMYVVTIS